MLKLSLETMNLINSLFSLACCFKFSCQCKLYLKTRLHDLAVHTRFVCISPNRGGVQVVQKRPISGFCLTPNNRVRLKKNHVFDHETWKSVLFPCYRLQINDFWSSYNQNLKIDIFTPLQQQIPCYWKSRLGTLQLILWWRVIHITKLHLWERAWLWEGRGVPPSPSARLCTELATRLTPISSTTETMEIQIQIQIWRWIQIQIWRQIQMSIIYCTQYHLLPSTRLTPISSTTERMEIQIQIWRWTQIWIQMKIIYCAQYRLLPSTKLLSPPSLKQWRYRYRYGYRCKLSLVHSIVYWHPPGWHSSPPPLKQCRYRYRYRYGYGYRYGYRCKLSIVHSIVYCHPPDSYLLPHWNNVDTDTDMDMDTDIDTKLNYLLYTVSSTAIHHADSHLLPHWNIIHHIQSSFWGGFYQGNWSIDVAQIWPNTKKKKNVYQNHSWELVTTKYSATKKVWEHFLKPNISSQI